MKQIIFIRHVKVDSDNSYKTDFELYTSETEAEIYIGVNYL